MSQQEPTGPYVYQPFGSVTHPKHAACGRLWGVAGVDLPNCGMFARIDGLTKPEAEAVCAALKALATKEGA
jgi:hypothetical protein